MDYESDEKLAAAFAERRSERAMDTLFRRTLPGVFSLTRRYFRVREDAEEAASETFLRAFRALRGQQYRGDASFRTWLLKIAANVCLERLRQPRLPTLTFDAIGDLAAHDEPVSAIDDAIASLPDDQRLALVLCDIEGYSSAEAAEVLGRSLTATKSLHYRARRAVRESLTHPA